MIIVILGRFLDYLNRKIIDFSKLKIFVLDEVD